jgi:hypothetical protein
MRFTPTFAALFVSVLATSVAANSIPQKVVFSATGVSDVTAKPDGCATIAPAGVSQTACVKHVFTNGFTMSVRGIPNTAEIFCSVSGDSGTCGPNNVEATVDLTGGTGSAPAPSGPSGTTSLSSADLSSNPISGSSSGSSNSSSNNKSSSNSSNNKSSSNSNNNSNSKDTKVVKETVTKTVIVKESDGKSNNDSKSSNNNKSSSSSKSSSKKSSGQSISQKVTFSSGSTSVSAKPDGCASITANGVKQTACVKHVFTNGFTMSVRGIPNTDELFCAVAGTTGTCGPDNVQAVVDLTGGTGSAPAATSPAGSPESDFSSADISSAPITRRHARDFLRY